MKNFFLIILTTFSLSCCNKDDNTTQDQLPPITTTGTNTVGCLVNGVVLLPKGGRSFGPPIVTCYYQYLNGSYEFGLGYSNNQQTELRGVTLLSNKLEFVQGNTYVLKNEDSNNSTFAFFNGGYNNGYKTTETIIGEIKIIKLDETNLIISGTFWFNAIKVSTGEIIHITEGRFDMQYTP